MGNNYNKAQVNLKIKIMKKIKKQLLLTKEDFEIIMGYVRTGLAHQIFGRKEADELQLELKKARLVDNSALPEDVVRLNSAVTIKDEEEDKVMEVTVVTPEKANIKQRKISILSPIGTALIGFKKGQKVDWRVPAGKKTFCILEVNNSLVQGAS